jgi:hypothetical protein
LGLHRATFEPRQTAGYEVLLQRQPGQQRKSP